MSTQVKLYVYDLSNGMARQLSRQLVGRQIDGIWYVRNALNASAELTKLLKCRHTSVVVFNLEFFYGQGILQTAPGQSHVRFLLCPKVDIHGLILFKARNADADS